MTRRRRWEKKTQIGKKMLDTVKINHVQHFLFTQFHLTDVVNADAANVILNGSLSYDHPPNPEDDR